MTTRLGFGLVVLLLAVAISSAGVAAADSITLTLNTMIDYDPDAPLPASSGAPTVSFTDIAAGKVRITLDLSALAATDEKVSEWLINCAIDLSAETTWTQISGPTTSRVSVNPVFDSTDASYKADGDGYFDVLFYWLKANGSPGGCWEPTVGASQVVWDVEHTGLSVESFMRASASGGGSGTWFTAAHVQSIGTGASSAWMAGGSPIPEPATFLLLGAGVAALGMWARRTRVRARRA